jgi:hypothetical protein
MDNNTAIKGILNLYNGVITNKNLTKLGLSIFMARNGFIKLTPGSRACPRSSSSLSTGHVRAQSARSSYVILKLYQIRKYVFRKFGIIGTTCDSKKDVLPKILYVLYRVPDKVRKL